MSIARLLYARVAAASALHHLRRTEYFMARAKAGNDDARARAKVHFAKAEKWQAKARDAETIPPAAG